MTLEQFTEAASRTKLQPRSLEAVRLVLVDGHGHSEAAKCVGVNRDKVRGWCARVLREHRGIMGCPSGWECITVCVPGDIADDVKKLERVAWRDYEKAKSK